MLKMLLCREFMQCISNSDDFLYTQIKPKGWLPNKEAHRKDCGSIYCGARCKNILWWCWKTQHVNCDRDIR